MAKKRFIGHRPEPHSHHEHPDPHLRPNAVKRLKLTFAIGLGLFFIEAWGSFISHSLALLADSFHVLADLAGVFVTLAATYLAERPQSSKRSYGYYRLEVLAALFNGLVLVLLAFFIVKSAVERFQTPHEIEAGMMLWVAVAGLAINIWMLMVLKPAHDHNLNLRGAYLHILGDTLSSVAVIISAGIIALTNLAWVDALTGIFVALMISWMASKLIWDSIHVLLEGTPKHMDPELVEASLRIAFPQIVNIHDFHIWEITAHLFAMTAHVEANVRTLDDTRTLVDGMNAFIKDRYGIGHTTFQVEPSN